MLNSPLTRRLKVQEPVQKQDYSSMDAYIFELMNASTKVHIAHLRVNGSGSYAAHTAMGSFYDSIVDLLDSVAEQYQGATESLLDFPSSCDTPTMSTAEECIVYLRELYQRTDEISSECPYSEIRNTLDEIKSLINITKYKLLYLK